MYDPKSCQQRSTVISERRNQMQSPRSCQCRSIVVYESRSQMKINCSIWEKKPNADAQMMPAEINCRTSRMSKHVISAICLQLQWFPLGISRKLSHNIPTPCHYHDNTHLRIQTRTLKEAKPESSWKESFLSIINLNIKICNDWYGLLNNIFESENIFPYKGQ